MNIFVLDNDPKIAAQMMCDKHVVKMLLESCQLMSTAHHILDGKRLVVQTKKGPCLTKMCENKNICKPTMVNHPCTIWTRASRSNYIWLWNHTEELCKEYTNRYGKIHAMEKMVLNELYFVPFNTPKIELTSFAQAMPEQYKNEDAVTAYRNYYINEKSRFAKWKKGNIPEWYSSVISGVAP